ncbi:4Fe-4S binding domain-containing protein [Mariniphaga anaerophila]|uniref:4Fe-4S binding domain-containing protein n=1 Tax=Mariniphaga anaerophila TaxID=1484053 RepID=A0A1M4VS74_9BACT|nr:4Fe-4S binding protein [Mariniphaga anaerophila]SHE71707.1 4Fe-4S binding domain-containing protein [Mariniphaga anaerophila]
MIKINALKRVSYSRLSAILAILILVIVYIAGLKRQEQQLKSIVATSFPELKDLQPLKTNPLLYEIKNHEHEVDHYLIFKKGMGWGGPFIVMAELDTAIKINKIEVLDHCETPSYMLKLQKNEFFKQFNFLPATSAFTLGNDLSAVTGATISSTGFTNAIKEGMQEAAFFVLGNEKQTSTAAFSFGAKEIILFCIFLLALIGSYLRFKKLRYLTLGISLIAIGFVYNFPFSISHFTSIFLGYVPGIYTNAAWWVVVGGALALIFITGKNLYCSSICPFGAMQELIAKISGFKLPIHPMVLKYGPKILYLLTFFAVVTMVYFRNTSSGNYEPFAALFNLDGYGLIWFILPVVLFSSFFWKRFYCRFLCPAGTALNLTNRFRNWIKHKIKNSTKNKSQCKKMNQKCQSFH